MACVRVVGRVEHTPSYASIADTKLRLEIAREQEVELDAMRQKNDPRMTERARKQEEYAYT